MGQAVLHLLVGPNGAGKSTYFARVLAPVMHLPWVNADDIAAERWPAGGPEHAYAAEREADARRANLLAERTSFASETVFSHPTKVDLVREAREAGYLVTLHTILVPVDLAVARVDYRVRVGGHSVPEAKVRQRFERLWSHVAEAMRIADETFVLDNSRADRPFRLVAHFQDGHVLGEPEWPAWTPPALRT